MGVMRKFLLISALVLLGVSTVRAEISPDEYLDPGYMMNAGYSEMMAADAIIHQSRSNGVPAMNIEEKAYHKKPFIHAVRKVFIYLDPALEDDNRYHHDIKLTPQYNDLL